MNYYELLGITESEKKLSEDEFKKVLKLKYRELSKQHHPDKGGDEEKFKQINEAYQILSDVNKRTEYDNPNQYGGNNLADFMRSHGYSFNQRKPTMNPNVEISMNIDITDVYFGKNYDIRYKTYCKCFDCDGNGGLNEQKCQACNGQKVRVEHTQFGIGVTPCNTCNGTGNRYETQCKTCSGRKVIEKTRTEKIQIPPSIINGETIGIRGLGNEINKNVFGDLFITVSIINNNDFELSSESPFDVIKTIYLDYYQMVIGDNIETNTVSGTIIKLTIPELTNDSKVLRLKRLGFRHKDRNNTLLDSYGNMIIKLKLKYPTEVSEEEKKQLIKAKKAKLKKS